MSKINDMKDFLSWRGFGEDEARYWARCFYKYTPCGPWAVFLMVDKPAHDVEHPPVTARIRCVRGQAKLLNPEDLDDDFIRFLGFDKLGLSRKERAWESYVELVDKFIADEEKMARTREIEISKRTVAELHITRPARVEHVNAVNREIYYEDIGPKYGYHEERCGCTREARAGHPDDPAEESYTDCDPDPDCDTCGGKGTFRKWAPTGEVITVDPELCVGIKFGSIVEGSEACSGPFTHMFPIDPEEFEKDLEFMEEETAFYWERDNSQWYNLHVRGRWYTFRNTWGEIVWDEKPSPKLRKKVEEFVNEHFDDIPREPRIWGKAPPEWAPLRIPGTYAYIHEYCNDTTFD